jgi:hypothetical protein
MKILTVGAEFFRADGQTDMTKLRVDFRNFSNVTKNPWWRICRKQDNKEKHKSTHQRHEKKAHASNRVCDSIHIFKR